MATVNWKTSREEFDKLTRIAERYEKLRKVYYSGDDHRTLLMDLTACHCNGCPLDLDLMLSAPDADFGHDVGGIQRYIDRESGQLTNCFVPRCAKRDDHVTESTGE